MIGREVRSRGNRIGFEILDLTSGRTGWLASISHHWGPQVGKYHVNLTDLNDIGVKAVVEAAQSLDAVIVDEIGPMELLSNRFTQAVINVAEGRKLVVCTIHWKMKSRLTEDVKKREDAEVYVVTHENRDKLPQIVFAKAMDFLSRPNT
jgi:nucleoside-triphosphatase